MHKSSYQNMQYFVQKYLDDFKEAPLVITDIGSQDIKGTYKPLFNSPAWKYIGVDMVKGSNVDVVLKDPYNWSEFSDSSCDVVISGQTFEHIEFFWITILEIRRILRPGGLLCLVAPSGGKEHRYPVDCWRFYPDGFRALAKYAALEVLESFAQWDAKEHPWMDNNWRDCVLIAKRPPLNYNILSQTGLSKSLKKNDTCKTVPNLFVLGSARCGTTTVHNVLNQHSDIHASNPKEPSFFCSYFRIINDPISYFNLFNNSKKYNIDSSHVYLSNPETPSVLKNLFPDAKFIVILRHPKNRAYSLYQKMREMKHSDGHPCETLDSFLDALNAEKQRYESKEFFDNCRQYFWNFMYTKSSLFDVQLKRYLSFFSRDQFHILTLSELVADPIQTVNHIIKFLKLDNFPLNKFEFKAWNASPDKSHTKYCSDCNDIMDNSFAGLTERVDELAGRQLDWSL
jgi:hypothetical protein